MTKKNKNELPSQEQAFLLAIKTHQLHQHCKLKTSKQVNLKVKKGSNTWYISLFYSVLWCKRLKYGLISIIKKWRIEVNIKTSGHIHFFLKYQKISLKNIHNLLFKHSKGRPFLYDNFYKIILNSNQKVICYAGLFWPHVVKYLYKAKGS